MPPSCGIADHWRVSARSPRGPKPRLALASGHDIAVSVEILDRLVYSEADAAEILRVPRSTLHWWLEGRSDNGRSYPPVIRPEPTGSGSLTWGEFIEAALLRQYRRKLDVRLNEIRLFVRKLRDEEGIPYPLAHSRPWVGNGPRLLLKVQEESGLRGDFWLVAKTTDQPVLTAPAASFISRVDWEDDLAIGWRPHDDENSPVRCRPTHRFGHPAIKGISTSAIFEHIEGGEDDEDVAAQFDLKVEEVGWARSYELSRRSATRAA